MNFELRMSGLVVLTFPDSAASMGHALLVRTEGHRPSLAYRLKPLKGGTPAPASDRLLTDPEGKLFASRELENEILTIQPSWPATQQGAVSGDTSLQGPGLKLHRASDVSPGARPNSDETVMEMAANLSAVETRLVQPTKDDRDAGVLPECLAKKIADGSPVIARLDFRHGVLRAQEPVAVEWDEWDGHPATEANLARFVTLSFEGLSELKIVSDKNDDLTFRANTAPGDPVVVSLTSEPAVDFKRTDDYVSHFHHLYQVARWIGDRPPERLRLPKISSKESVTDKICPSAAYALP